MGFKEDLDVGHIGEFVCWNMFQRMRGIRSVVDVRDDSYFQSVDVDFLVENINRQFIWMEVKTDLQTYRTGNIAYEAKTSGNIGCYEKTKAHYIVYYVPQSGNVYFLITSKLRLLANSGRYQLKAISKDTDGYLIPIADMEKAGVVDRMFKAEVLSWDG